MIVSSEQARAGNEQAGLLPRDFAVAVLVPCYNEDASIGKVVEDFRRALPMAIIYVYDNNSTDRSVEIAREAGAIVRFEPLQGKGNVVRRMFADIEADIYVLVDGDDTYDPACAPMLIQRMIDDKLDMINAARVAEDQRAYRRGHRWGNVALTLLVARIFGNRFRDMLSGYRVLSRRFVKSFPALTGGFEIETELTIHALELRASTLEVPTPYRQRHPGSPSKLSTVRDGLKILRTVLILLKEERPLPFFAALSGLLAAASLVLGWPLVIMYLETGGVPRFPTAILATGLMVLALVSLTCGLVLDTVTRGRRELKRLYYLSIPAAPAKSHVTHR